jgi:hypothetical protein
MAPVRVECDGLERSAAAANATSKDAQVSRVTRNGMILVVAQHNLPKPYTDLRRTVMLPALKFSLDGFQLRGHPLLRRDPPDDEWSSGQLPTEVSETQEREGLRLSRWQRFRPISNLEFRIEKPKVSIRYWTLAATAPTLPRQDSTSYPG